MASYRMCGLTIQSNVLLPELPQVEEKEPDCAFHLLPAQEPAAPEPSSWFHHWRSPDGEVWLSFARQGPHYLLRFPRLADFLVSGEGREVSCSPVSDTALETIRHLFLDQVLPVVMSRRGKLVLHASAVAVPGGAIAFAGTTGRGKSTLASHFAVQGFPLLTDDCLLLEEQGDGLAAVPSYPGVRLREDVVALWGDGPRLSPVAHYTKKKRLGLNHDRQRFCPEPVPLCRVFFLTPPEPVRASKAVAITPLTPREAFMELLSFAFKLDITDRDRLRAEFECLGRWAALPLFHRLTYPRDLSFLPAVRNAILENLGKG